jgi:hypothetical protein
VRTYTVLAHSYLSDGSRGLGELDEYAHRHPLLFCLVKEERDADPKRSALFCGLRGFIGFTESAGAEDVMALLAKSSSNTTGRSNGTLVTV